MDDLEKNLSYLILARKGGINRGRIIRMLMDGPANINQIAKSQNLNYRTAQRHVDILTEFGMVHISDKGGYGDVCSLDPELISRKTLVQEYIARISSKEKVKDATIASGFTQKVLGKTSDGILVLDENWEVVYSNRSFERLLGYDKISKNEQLDFLLDPHSKKHLVTFIEKNGTVKNFKTKLRSREGNPVDTSMTVDSLKSDDGTVKGYAFVVRDERERAHSEKVVQLAMQKYRFLFNHSPTTNYIVNPEGIVRDLNENGYKPLQLRKKDILGQTLGSIMSESSKREFESMLERSRNNDHLPVVELDFIGHDGNVRNYRFFSERISVPDGDDGFNLMLTGIDMTELLRMEALVETSSVNIDAFSKNQLRSIFESIPVGVALFEPDQCRSIFMNTVAMDILNLDRTSTSFSLDDADFRLLTPEGSPIDECDLPYNVSLRERRIATSELLLSFPDGAERHILATTNPLLKSDGTIWMIMMAFKDITEIMMIQYNLELSEQELKAQNAELIRSQLELELSRNEFADAFEASPVGFLKIDGYGLIDNINETASRMLSIKRTHASRKPLYMMIREPDREYARRQIRDMISSGKEICMTLKVNSEGERRVMFISKPSLNGNGNFFLLACIDLSKEEDMQMFVERPGDPGHGQIHQKSALSGSGPTR